MSVAREEAPGGRRPSAARWTVTTGRATAARELARSRRTQLPLSVVLLEVAWPRGRRRETVRRLIEAELRVTDAVVSDPRSPTLVVLATDTPCDGATILAERLVDVARAQGTSARASLAEFPRDGLDLDALLHAARRLEPWERAGGPDRPGDGRAPGLGEEGASRREAEPSLRVVRAEVREQLPDARTLTRVADRLRWVRARRRRTRRSIAYQAAKRALDVAVVAVVALPALGVLCACVVALKLEHPDEPVFFVQDRTGRAGRRFRMYKLRTMRSPGPGEAVLRGLDGVKTVDPRVTRVGRVLRKASLDELPQLLNVLKGDMSLVGPRPTAVVPPDHTLWQTARLEVRPGLTGLWQVAGRGTLPFSERCRLDIRYVQRRSLLVDLEILVRTVPAVLSGRGAV